MHKTGVTRGRAETTTPGCDKDTSPKLGAAFKHSVAAFLAGEVCVCVCGPVCCGAVVTREQAVPQPLGSAESARVSGQPSLSKTDRTLIIFLS